MTTNKTFNDLFPQSRISLEELREIKGFENKNEEDLNQISNILFDLSLLFHHSAKELNKQNEVTYMNVKTVSTYLGVSKSTIYKWVEKGFIPGKKLGKHLLFIKKEIDQWVENGGVLTNDLPELPKSIKKSDNGNIPLRA